MKVRSRFSYRQWGSREENAKRTNYERISLFTALGFFARVESKTSFNSRVQWVARNQKERESTKGIFPFLWESFLECKKMV
jgi:hypothetical protein